MAVYEHDYVTTSELIICVLLSGISLLLFYGNRQHRPGFYVPFLIYSASLLFDSLHSLTCVHLLAFIYILGT